MSDERPESQWHAELLSALDQLFSVRDELRGDENTIDLELITEVDGLLSKARRAVDALARLHPVSDADTVNGSGTRGFDPLTFVSTVGITTFVLPFVQSLVQNAGNDVYRTLVELVRRRRTARSVPQQDPECVMLGDSETDVCVAIDAAVDKAALDALRTIDLSGDSLRDATLRWNPHRKVWEPDPGHRSVDLWLPGDPLDDGWDK